MHRRLLSALSIATFIAGVSAAVSGPTPTSPHIYAVVFAATVDSNGKIDTLVVSKVIDPSSGTTDAVEVAVPKDYLAAARDLLRQRTYPTNPGHFFTYTFFDPTQPSKADIDPKADRP